MAPPLKPVTDLRQLSVCTVVDNLSRFMVTYEENFIEILNDERPTFGPFGSLKSDILFLIIDELLKREELTCDHLKVLLPEDAELLTCAKNTMFTPYGCNTVELISERCPGFKMLHCHYEKVRTDGGVLFINEVLAKSISRLKLLQEINLCNTWVENETIRCIALNCFQLRELNLHRTNLSKNDVDSLLDDNSVIKNSLTKLIIDKSDVPRQSVEQCLLGLKNLTKFQSDKTISAVLQLFEAVKQFPDAAHEFPKFKTTICKNQFAGKGIRRWTDSFLRWLVIRFPEIKHLCISLQLNHHGFVGRLIKSWNNITQLELASWGERDSVSFLLPSIITCKNLITLKLENFVYINVATLGNNLKKLEKLTLVNNSYVRNQKAQFENLKELQILLFADKLKHPSLKLYFDYMHMPYELLNSILSSENIEKVFLYDQMCFVSYLVKSLLSKGCLRNLNELKVFKCLLKIDCIWELFFEPIPITNIVVGFCDNISKEDIDFLSNYCKENNLSASIKLALENPSYLKWLVQNAEVPS